ncbi:MAG: C4-dicarboxylate transporter DcuC [Candidatus Accumulibacter sp.]|jgi:DcuC family C4-dicarboxylate transporter|nr:C4-dicarboxylate transporter DcuC [Accumulibacter sp.]
MAGFIISIVVTIIAARLIINDYQPQTVLLIAGVVLLTVSLVFFPGQYYGETKPIGIGWTVFAIFAFTVESLAARIANVGLIIMAAGGFADYMNHIKASNAMVNLCIRPLRLIKAPYVVLAVGYIFGQILHVAISSATGLAMLLLVTFFPILVRLGVSKAAAAAMIGMTAFMDLGPSVGTANLAAQQSGMESAVYFVRYQIPVAIGVMIVVAILIYFTARYYDEKEGHVAVALVDTDREEAEGDTVPAFYALLPAVPVTLVLVFDSWLVKGARTHVIIAMIVGAMLALVCELLTKRDAKNVFKGFQTFFNGMGKMFASVVSLLACANVFTQGFQATGAVSFVIDSVSGMGLGGTAMTVVMTLLVGATAIITGSGVAGFFAFSGLAPDMAAGFGISAVSMILPMQLVAGMGRALSPVAGVIVAVSKSGAAAR